MRRVPPYLIVLAAYSALVLLLLAATPLWLDEIRQLGLTRQRTWGELLSWVQLEPGAAPLPYVVQEALVRLLGRSTFVIRLPAALASILAGFVFFRICRQLQVKRPVLALLIFLAIPLQFRYALEARGYSLALLFSLAAFSLFLRLDERPSAGGSVWYGLSILAGLYSQPLTAFPVIVQVFQARRAWLPALLAAAAFLPWAVLQHGAQQAAGTLAPYFFSAAQISPEVLLHDLAGGGGYFATLILLGLAFFGRTGLLSGCFLAAFAGPIALDAAMGYFFAARQLIFAIPFLVLLAARGAAALPRVAAVAALGTFFAAAAVADYARATQPKDDFALAASTLRAWSGPDACVLPVPPDHAWYYAFFEPVLEKRICPASPRSPRILAISSGYTTPADERNLAAGLPNGYAAIREVPVGRRSRVRVYESRH